MPRWIPDTGTAVSVLLVACLIASSSAVVADSADFLGVEDGDDSEWSNQDSLPVATTTSYAVEGTHALRVETDTGGTRQQAYFENRKTERGDDYVFYMRPAKTQTALILGYQKGTKEGGYHIGFDFKLDKDAFIAYSGGSGTNNVDVETVPRSEIVDEWVKVEVNWTATGVEATFSNLSTGQQYASLSYADQSYQSGAFAVSGNGKNGPSYYDGGGPIKYFDDPDAFGSWTADGFEDNDLSEYSGDTGAASITSSPALNGTYSLEMSSGGSEKIISTSGLDSYPRTGDTITYETEISNGGVSGLMFGVQNDTHYYRISLDGNGQFTVVEDGSDTVLLDQNRRVDQGDLIDVEIRWNATGFRVIVDSSDFSIDETVSTSAYSGGGVGYSVSGGGTVLFDGAGVKERSATATDVSGAVQNSSGGSLANATVKAYNRDNSSFAGETLTNTTGAYSLALPPANYSVSYVKSGYSVNTTDVFLTESTTLDVALSKLQPGDDADPTDTDGDGTPDDEDNDDDGDGIPDGEDPDDDGDGVPDTEETVVTGTVSNTDGDAIGGADILALDDNGVHTTVANASGGYRLRLNKSGTADIQADARGYNASNATVSLNNGVVEQDFTLSGSGPETTEVDGIVSNTEGDPIPGATVTADGPNGVQTASTDAAGFYQFELNKTGSATVNATATGFGETTASLTLTGTTNIVQDVTLTRVDNSTGALPSELILRNESEPTLTINGSNASATAYRGDEVITYNSSSELVDLEDVSGGRETAVVVRADGYHPRVVTGDVVAEQGAVFLPSTNGSAPATTQVIFALDDRTGRFPPRNTTLYVKRGLGAPDGDKYYTVTSDQFGASGEQPTQLVEGARYRLVVVNEAGETRVLSHYTVPEQDVVSTLPIAEVAIAADAQNGSASALARRLADSSAIRFTYYDPDEATSEVSYSLLKSTPQTSNITVDTGTIQGPHGLASTTISINPVENATYTLTVSTPSGFSRTFEFGRPTGVGDRLTQHVDAQLLALAGYALVVAVAGAAVLLAGWAGAAAATLTASALALLGVMPVDPVLLGIAGAATVVGYIGRAD
jgi:hypothetical protein